MSKRAGSMSWRSLNSALGYAAETSSLKPAMTADGTIRVVEAALMRMVGAVLDCPLPPLFEELDPETLAA